MPWTWRTLGRHDSHVDEHQSRASQYSKAYLTCRPRRSISAAIELRGFDKERSLQLSSAGEFQIFGDVLEYMACQHDLKYVLQLLESTYCHNRKTIWRIRGLAAGNLNTMSLITGQPDPVQGLARNKRLLHSCAYRRYFRAPVLRLVEQFSRDRLQSSFVRYHGSVWALVK